MQKVSDLSEEIFVSVKTDVGCVRDSNEDAGCFLMPSDPSILAAKGRLTVVADGMGGHSGGEVASALAIETISRAYYAASEAPAESLRSAFEEANRRIYEESIADQRLSGMGTTCTALVLYRNSAIAAHVGDSRLYLLREGELYLLTEDHSAVMEMVKLGIITVEQARHHEDKNVIVRALGTSPSVEVSLWENPMAVRTGDQFLLCSDGLYDLVEDEAIRDLVLTSPDTYSACENLIDLAKRKGGFDNITVALVSIRPAAYIETRKLRATREAEVVL
jgi:protein phosphatase